MSVAIDMDAATRPVAAEDAPATSYRVGEDVVVVTEPGSPQAESIGALRTHIMAQHLPAGRRSLALCSPTGNVGCTSLAVNLAVALAEGGIKTLLIDADLRDPAVERLIVPSQAGPGLLQCLGEERASFGDAIRPEVLPNLSILYAGGRSERPQELLSGPRFQQLVDLCVRDFDIVLADTPPASLSADARRVASVLGYAMIVAGRDRTFVNDMRVLIEELQSDNAVVVGSVLTQG